MGSARYKAKKLAFFKKYTDQDKEMLTRVAQNEQALLKSNSLKDLDASGVFFDSSRRTFADTFALQLSKGDKKAETFAEKLFEKIEKDLHK